MKQQVSTPIIVAAVVGVLLIAALIGWWAMSSSSREADSATINAHISAKRAKHQD